MAFEVLHRRLTELGKFLKDDLQKELKLQKHNASSRLSDSIEMQVQQTNDKIILRELHNFYGDFVDRGRKAGLKRVPIAALETWVRLKGFAPGNERGVAFAIQKKIFEQGIPTRRSSSLAPRRLNWLTGTIEQNNDRIEATLEEAVILDLNVIIDNILATTNAEIKAQG